MAGSIYGTILKVTTWGESHGKGIGVVVDGCPAGLPLTEADIQVYLDRRKPGQSKFTTARQEGDVVEILSGVFEGRTTGTPIALEVRNTDQRSHDYGNIMDDIVPDMRIIPLTVNMGLGITAAAGVPQAVRLPAGWLQGLLPVSCLKALESL